MIKKVLYPYMVHNKDTQLKVMELTSRLGGAGLQMGSMLEDPSYVLDNFPADDETCVVAKLGDDVRLILLDWRVKRALRESIGVYCTSTVMSYILKYFM